MKNKALFSVIAPLILSTILLSPAAPAATAPSPSSDPVTGDALVVSVERALLDITYACLLQTGAVPTGTPASAVVGDILATGEAIAPTMELGDLGSDCASQAASMVHSVVVANASDATAGVEAASELASVADGGEVVFDSSKAEKVKEPKKDKGDTAGQAATLEAVTPDTWINGMNNKQDMWMDFFITGYGSPGHYNWSSDECTAPLAGNSPWNFEWPCRRHDFSWRNLKSGEARFPNHNMWNLHNKAVSDRQFNKDLVAHCAYSANPASCRSDAAVYHYAVSQHGENTWGMDVHTLFKFQR